MKVFGGPGPPGAVPVSSRLLVKSSVQQRLASKEAAKEDARCLHLLTDVHRREVVVHGGEFTNDAAPAHIVKAAAIAELVVDHRRLVEVREIRIGWNRAEGGVRWQRRVAVAAVAVIGRIVPAAMRSLAAELAAGLDAAALAVAVRAVRLVRAAEDAGGVAAVHVAARKHL